MKEVISTKKFLLEYGCDLYVMVDIDHDKRIVFRSTRIRSRVFFWMLEMPVHLILQLMRTMGTPMRITDLLEEFSWTAITITDAGFGRSASHPDQRELTKENVWNHIPDVEARFVSFEDGKLTFAGEAPGCSAEIVFGSAATYIYPFDKQGAISTHHAIAEGLTDRVTIKNVKGEVIYSFTRE